tara:strand:- start:257 stop:649 length:393 start_codon:yes stop_codon:yes gene_type:complete
MYLVYILKSEDNKKSYIGMTNDFLKRWMQHNKIIKGGAKYTSKHENWNPVCIIDGFKNKSEAMQCEWRLKHMKVRGYYNRLIHLSMILENSQNIQWTTNSPIISTQSLTLYVIEEYKHLFQINTHELYWF